MAPAPRRHADRTRQRLFWLACVAAALVWLAAAGAAWRGADLAWVILTTCVGLMALSALHSWLFVPEELGQVASALGLRFRPRGLYPFNRHVSPYRGRKLTFRQVSGRPTTSILHLEHPYHLGLGLHSGLEKRSIGCDDRDLLARPLSLADPAIRCYADADSGAAALVSRPAVKQAFDALDGALPEEAGGFAVCDDGVRITLPAGRPVSAPMVQAMAAISDAVSSGPAPAPRRPRQLYGVRILVLVLAVPAVILGLMGILAGVVDGSPAGLVLSVPGAALGYVWWRLRSRQ